MLPEEILTGKEELDDMVTALYGLHEHVSLLKQMKKEDLKANVGQIFRDTFKNFRVACTLTELVRYSILFASSNFAAKPNLWIVL